MQMLCVGLNPSPMSAQLGMGFARPGNRFWPAALRAGVVTRDRDSIHALVHHGIGMTDLVKRPTRGAAELSRDEYHHGIERLALLCEWLRPHAVCIIGLAGWRAAVDRKAVTGWQPGGLGGRSVYVMPNPSGLNAHDTVDTLAAHLATAYGGRS
jgi:TDG/mug DNA glycosylase family protein